VLSFGVKIGKLDLTSPIRKDQLTTIPRGIGRRPFRKFLIDSGFVPAIFFIKRIKSVVFKIS
jgi:hypothetical protein